ncbi:MULTISPECIES: DUF6247 family protein [Streptomyces]|uniref:DUF6247 family protein n=1 Tax=Streptomyces TaxID=1883 RepID=UPI000F773A99|nr:MULTISPECIES: DUF6247 family protein [Streptomyces]RSS99060.1 hypothetical protein EF910_37020 [Streptomyces sp. WAC07149]GLX24025.1 hypothetical protein Slala01_76690 [Streptomyces lavendulae subsp. lavendulae]GLX31902.1 hypothetical protein Slala02_77210 [Streptomyces lavendulae subsp. lavendulae]
MSAQPEHVPAPPRAPAPAPAAPAELHAALRADRRAERWVPAFEAEWARALEEARRTFSLAGPYEVLGTWQARLASAPRVDAFLTAGRDETGFVGPEELRRRPRASSG